MTVRQRTAVWVGLAAMALSGAQMRGQAPQAQGPVMSPATEQAQQAKPQSQTPAEPSAPGAQLKPRTGTPENPFPPVDPKNFTASSPTSDTVNSFLKAIWGYSENRIWSVAAIQKTPAPGVARVVVYIADKRQPGKAGKAVFFTTPDGNYVIADQVMPFGANPFESIRKLMQDRANGPAAGATSKDLEIVEFSALQCANCAAAHEKVEQLQQDFPQARFVFEDMPVGSVSPLGPRASAIGICVRQAKGDAAFYQYAKYLFAHQSVLTPASGEETMKNAVTAAGADPAAAATCADTQRTRDEVHAPIDLATQAGVEAEPSLLINGRVVAVGGVDYETLKSIVAYQAGMDGIKVNVQPTLKTLK